MNDLSANQLKLISDAALYLEKPSLLMEIANVVGKPLEFFTRGLDKIAAGRVEEAVNMALRTALSVAVYTVPADNAAHHPLIEENINDIGTRVAFWHKVSVAITGTAGGLFGLPGLAVELPLTTTIMLRSIAAIAQDFGEDLSEADIRLQCLSVFCLGGPGRSDDAMESAYLTSRMGLQAELTMASRAAAGMTTEQLSAMIQKGTAPALVNLLGRIASRFNVAVTEKMIAQAIPILGAATGAAINVAFMGHFNRVARFHFGLRQLERQHGV
ncbi:MAG: EcsC family protein, partial [Planctomycetes bacterium]|nr:EcsC family protein [Planctomycetota bacterium]